MGEYKAWTIYLVMEYIVFDFQWKRVRTGHIKISTIFRENGSCYTEYSVQFITTINAEVNCSDLPIVYGYSAQLLLKVTVQIYS
jgi:hypothetical protein